MSQLAHESRPESIAKGDIEAMEEKVSSEATDITYPVAEELSAPPTLTAEEERRLWRKIDLRLLPILIIMYLVASIDRSNIGNAKLQGLLTQLNLTGDQYNVALLAWGIIAITMWYPRHMVQYRVGLFWGGATFAGAFSGLLAFAISFMSGTAGLLGWSWIFIIEGLITIVVAVAAFFILVDFPDTAMFLTPEERAYVVHRKKYDNSSVGEEEHFEMRQLWETLFNWKVIVCCLINASVITPAAAVVAWSKWSDIHQKRSPSILAGLLFCLVGFAINAADTPIGVRYFGTFLVVTGGYAGFPGNVSWMGNNTVGHYRRAIAIGMQVMFANAGGAIASNIYRVQDAPRYLLGHAVELGFVGMGLTLLPIMVFTYSRANAQRDAAQRDMEVRGVKIEYSTEELRKMGNQAPDFRYTL
ncbi:High-affinity nicotinic acid transporter [Trametes pubescens]|uniref:High-affinity nicotinic acid transporter n=1 Tax=Trametes pubescens TaxID=154538 RepID=A0A1M2V7W9_TRAPU|nr:High-affinity nicotinic acid transporter [Trametes pubescens]